MIQWRKTLSFDFHHIPKLSIGFKRWRIGDPKIIIQTFKIYFAVILQWNFLKPTNFNWFIINVSARMVAPQLNRQFI